MKKAFLLAALLAARSPQTTDWTDPRVASLPADPEVFRFKGTREDYAFPTCYPKGEIFDSTPCPREVLEFAAVLRAESAAARHEAASAPPASAPGATMEPKLRALPVWLSRLLYGHKESGPDRAFYRCRDRLLAIRLTSAHSCRLYAIASGRDVIWCKWESPADIAACRDAAYGEPR